MKKPLTIVCLFSVCLLTAGCLFFTFYEPTVFGSDVEDPVEEVLPTDASQSPNSKTSGGTTTDKSLSTNASTQPSVFEIPDDTLVDQKQPPSSEQPPPLLVAPVSTLTPNLTTAPVGQQTPPNSPSDRATQNLLSSNTPPVVSSQSQNVEPSFRASNSRLQIGANYMHVNTKLQGQPSFNGNLFGAQGMYEYRPMDSFYGAAKLGWSTGDIRGPSAKCKLAYLDAQVRAGYTFICYNNALRLAFFSGVGCRNVDQKLNPTAASSIRFNYNEFYIPVGLMGDYTINNQFAVGIAFTWMPQIYSTLDIQSLRGGRWYLPNQFGNFSVEMPFTFMLTEDKRFSLIFCPFYEYWRDGHTTAVTASGKTLGLPGSVYNFWGANLNLGYSF